MPWLRGFAKIGISYFPYHLPGSLIPECIPNGVFSVLNKLIILTLFTAIPAFAAPSKQEDLNLDLIISATSQPGTMNVQGQQRYMKRFHINVLNTSNHEILLQKGCYVATDKAGKRHFYPKIFSPTVLGILKPGAEGNHLEGDLEYTSVDDSVLHAEFISWSETCSNK